MFQPVKHQNKTLLEVDPSRLLLRVLFRQTGEYVLVDLRDYLAPSALCHAYQPTVETPPALVVGTTAKD